MSIQNWNLDFVCYLRALSSCTSESVQNLSESPIIMYKGICTELTGTWEPSHHLSRTYLRALSSCTRESVQNLPESPLIMYKGICPELTWEPSHHVQGNLSRTCPGSLVVARGSLLHTGPASPEVFDFRVSARSELTLWVELAFSPLMQLG
jgi:hypothetical protein